MANSFPAPPSGWALSSVSYSAVLPAPALQPGAALEFGAGVTSELVYVGPVMGMAFIFSTPGSFGAYDQAVVEPGFAQAITGVCNVLASMSGAALASLQAQVQVTRTWTWTAGGVSIATSDAMPYP